MINKMGSCKTFKLMDVEVKEYVKKILKNVTLSSTKNNNIHHYVEHEAGDEDPQVITIVESTPQYINFLQLPLKHTKRKKLVLNQLLIIHNYKFLQQMHMLRH